MDLDELVRKVNELRLIPWVQRDPAIITIYFDGELRVKPPTAELVAKQQIIFEAVNVDAQVVLPAKVLAASGEPILEQPGPVQSFMVSVGDPVPFNAYDIDIDLAYLVTFEPKPGKIEAIRRPPVIIIKTVDS